jgi:hypothetical protein
MVPMLAGWHYRLPFAVSGKDIEKILNLAVPKLSGSGTGVLMGKKL